MRGFHRQERDGMEPLFDKAGLEALGALTSGEPLLVFDFDGTLAPSVDEPDEARPRPSTFRLLRSVAERFPCAVISGRTREDVLRRLEGVALREVAGNHGLEPWFASARFERQVAEWLPVLRARLGRLEGVALEDKRFSVALHYRRAARKRQALAAIRQAVAALGNARLVTGKLVANVLPDRAPDKGMALEQLRAQLGASSVLFIGDDETDEAGFRLPWPTLVPVRVGFKRGSAARFYLRDQADIDSLLRRLDGARPPRRMAG
jgi:trehalose 6-phosphate phosphatase